MDRISQGSFVSFGVGDSPSNGPLGCGQTILKSSFGKYIR